MKAVFHFSFFYFFFFVHKSQLSLTANKCKALPVFLFSDCPNSAFFGFLIFHDRSFRSVAVLWRETSLWMCLCDSWVTTCEVIQTFRPSTPDLSLPSLSTSSAIHPLFHSFPGASLRLCLSPVSCALFQGWGLRHTFHLAYEALILFRGCSTSTSSSSKRGKSWGEKEERGGGGVVWVCMCMCVCGRGGWMPGMKFFCSFTVIKKKTQA